MDQYIARKDYGMGNDVNLIHCSYHKCLTVYYGRVLGILCNWITPWRGRYHHFNSKVDEFYHSVGGYRLVSINNHKLDFTRLGNFRISRFVRDPRDLVVSGYFYHKKGVERWCNIVAPNEEDWNIVNGNIPVGMGINDSFSSYLQKLPQDDGLIAEIEFRKYHFQSMMEWPTQDPRIRIFRYEDILGNEEQTFRKLFEFYDYSPKEQSIGMFLADRFSAKRRRSNFRHIRNPAANQWREYFTPRVKNYFDSSYENLLLPLGYPLA